MHHSLIWNLKRLAPLRDFQAGNHIEHGGSIVETLDGFRRVDYDDVWLMERELPQLVFPIGAAVEFVDDAIERSLLG